MPELPARLPTPSAELALLQGVIGLRHLDENHQSTLQDAAFVCIDCEAFEHDHTIVTEIGVAVFDTRDIKQNESLKEDKSDYTNLMRYAHYRILENAEFVNRQYVKGCENDFNFGKTTWIKLSESSSILKRIFIDPSRLADAAKLDVIIPDPKRNVIFVAHGLKNDSAFLAQLGFQLDRVPLVRRVDTQVVAGGTKKKPMGLRRLADLLELQPQHLHNAGNDAAYTLQALLVMISRDYEASKSDIARLPQLKPARKSRVQVGANNSQRNVNVSTPAKRNAEDGDDAYGDWGVSKRSKRDQEFSRQ